jgi:glycosidase
MKRSIEFLWWQRGVIYQVYPRSFADANGDGIGDLAGVIGRLDYLADTLGVDAVWLSPIFPSPMADFGYDVSDYTGIDPIFGSLTDFDELLTQAHRRSLKIILDFVPNHCSDQHPWFLESRSSRDNPKRDWYVWADPRPDGSLPNNWLSVFGGPAWEWDERTGQYYLHSFLKEQPDLNWRNPEVKAAMLDVLRFWLERGVDGFRIDVAHFIMKDPDLRDNPLKPGAGRAIHKSLGDYDSLLHVNDQGHPDTHAVYREIRKLLDSFSKEQPRVSIGEVHIFDWPAWATYYGSNLDEIHLPFNFQLLGVEMNADAIRQVVDGLEASLPPGAWPNYVMGNHDESRLASRVGPENARLAALLLLSLRGTPTLYYGDEIGMQDVLIPDEAQQDPWGIRVPGQGRDKCRTPMQWDDSPNAGFSEAPAGKIWLPLAGDHPQVNVKRQLEQPESILNLYRWLLTLRRSSPALQTGDYFPVDGAPEGCYVFLRRAPGSQAILAALNFSQQEKRLSLTVGNSGRLLASTLMDRSQQVGNRHIDLSSLVLRGKEGVLIELPDE